LDRGQEQEEGSRRRGRGIACADLLTGFKMEII